MTREETDEFYDDFLTIISEDILEEVAREGKFFPVEVSIENRLDDLREDIKDKIKQLKS